MDDLSEKYLAMPFDENLYRILFESQGSGEGNYLVSVQAGEAAYVYGATLCRSHDEAM